ncbi:MAG: hypothetical protein SGILL_002385, partial [Bacillariaceae sp.]
SWMGGQVMMFYFYMGMHTNFLPIDDIPEEDKNMVLGSIGYVGLKWNELVWYGNGCIDEMSLVQLKAFFTKLVTDEILELSAATAKRRSRPRRLSVLRTSGTRVSDAGELEMLANRLSEQRGAGHIDDVNE